MTESQLHGLLPNYNTSQGYLTDTELNRLGLKRWDLVELRGRTAEYYKTLKITQKKAADPPKGIPPLVYAMVFSLDMSTVYYPPTQLNIYQSVMGQVRIPILLPSIVVVYQYEPEKVSWTTRLVGYVIITPDKMLSTNAVLVSSGKLMVL
jgi:hypothetical protein